MMMSTESLKNLVIPNYRFSLSYPNFSIFAQVRITSQLSRGCVCSQYAKENHFSKIPTNPPPPSSPFNIFLFLFYLQTFKKDQFIKSRGEHYRAGGDVEC